MPKMTHWNSPEPIDVAPEKLGVYVAQGWTAADKPAKQSPVTAVTTDSVEPTVDAEPKPAKRTAKKTTSKK